MRHRDARVRRRGEGRGHPGHDLEAQPRSGERLGLFPAAAEEKRIAAFQPQHAPAGGGLFHEQRVDFLLPQRVLPRLFAGVDHLHALAGAHFRISGLQR